MADMVLQKMPTVDAVEVVRCKDCKYYYLDKGCHNRAAGVLVRRESDDFCSYGERKDGDGNG